MAAATLIRTTYLGPLQHRLVLWVTLAGTLSVFAIAPGLFLQHRFLGPVPAADWITLPGPPVDWFYFVLLVGVLIPAFWMRSPGWLLLVWCGLFLARCLFDRILWQPYLLQYWFTLFSLAWVNWQPRFESEDRNRAVLDCQRFMIACIYFWSGISKLNYANLVTGPRQLLSPLEETGLVPILSLAWAAATFVELALPFGLLSRSRRLRITTVSVAILLHVSILLIFGPFGLAHNPVVWPWNLVMICLLWILFASTPAESSDRKPRRIFLQPLAVIVFGWLPLLSYFGLWSPYLSFRMYSHLYHHTTLMMKSSVVEQLDPSIREHVLPTDHPDWDGMLHVSHWGETQLNAFPPTDLPVSKHIAARICQSVDGRNGMVLLVVSPPNVLTGKTNQQILACEDLP